MDEINVEQLIEENTKLKLRIADLEKQLEEFFKKDKPQQKKLVPPSKDNIPVYCNDNYFYWI